MSKRNALLAFWIIPAIQPPLLRGVGTHHPRHSHQGGNAVTDPIAELSDLFAGPADKIPESLRAAGLLPSTEATWPVSAEAFDAPTLGVVFAHIDPQRPHVDGKAGVYGSFPSGLHTEFVPPELIIWGGGANFSYLILYILGFGANTAGVASVDLRVLPPEETTASISATGNPATMVLTNAGTGNTRVTVQVPFTTTSSGFASVLIMPRTTRDGVLWHGMDIRTV
jgi:hypothetical protein